MIVLINPPFVTCVPLRGKKLQTEKARVFSHKKAHKAQGSQSRELETMLVSTRQVIVSILKRRLFFFALSAFSAVEPLCLG